MTVQELYEYAKQCGVSDYEIRVQLISIIGAFVTLMGAFAFGWMGNLPMTIAMLAGVIYFKEYK